MLTESKAAMRKTLLDVLDQLNVCSKARAEMPSKISEMELTAYTDGYNADSISRSTTADESNHRAHLKRSKQRDCSKMENRIEMDKLAYIAGDTASGYVIVRTCEPMNLKSINLKLVGKATAQYFNAKMRAQKLCEVPIPVNSTQEHCLESRKRWKIPFSIQLDKDLASSIDSGLKGRVTYNLHWDLVCDRDTISNKTELIILAHHALDHLPRREEMSGTNEEEEEYDMMKLCIYSPAKAYLPGERIQFRATAQNVGKKPIKKLAVLILQNVLFFKSEMRYKGRMRSFLMSVKEKPTQIKQGEGEEWTDEIQLPDPIPPSIEVFHKTNYELVLVAITKGNKSSIQKVFDQARYHFDLEKYRDEYFRDFLPHACCNFEVGSHHGDKRSSSLTGGHIITPINHIWNLQSKEETQKKHGMSKCDSEPRMIRITFHP